MNLEHLLAGVAPRQWVTRQAIVLDWTAGPRTGVCALAHPRCELFFRLFAEPLEGDLLAVRLFAVSELQSGAVAQIEALLQELGRPAGPLWVPSWIFREETVRRDIEGQLDALLVVARPTALLAATGDWLHFDGCWNVDRVPPPRRPEAVNQTPS
jgi:hypothetical protein